MFIFVLCISDVSTSAYWQQETHQIAQNATFYPLKQSYSPYTKIDSEKELVGEILKQVVLSKQSDSDIKVQILDVDLEEGLIDVNIVQTYQHVNGKKEEIANRKTIILEEE